MARDTSAQCKQCRREGQKLFLKGARCFTDKCGVERRSYPPGEHGRGRMRQSEYRAQLREKQKARALLPGAREAVPRATTTRRAASRASPARTCCACWSAASTTCWCASASPPRAARPGSWSATGTGR